MDVKRTLSEHPTHPVCERLEPGTPVGVRLRCKRHGCNTEWDGSAEVVNAYGVKDTMPGQCPRCELRAYTVLEIIDVSEGDR